MGRVTLLVEEKEGGEIDLGPSVEGDLLPPKPDGLPVQAIPVEAFVAVDPHGFPFVGVVEPGGVGPDLAVDGPRGVHDVEVPEGAIVPVLSASYLLHDEGAFEGLSLDKVANLRDGTALWFRQIDPSETPSQAPYFISLRLWASMSPISLEASILPSPPLAQTRSPKEITSSGRP